MGQIAMSLSAHNPDVDAKIFSKHKQEQGLM